MLQEKNRYQLKISDNGKGYEVAHENSGLGLSLVRTLVQEQLDGTIIMENKNGVTCMIEYKI